MSITPKSLPPRYYQIMTALREQITTGSLRSGDLLPSERELCTHFGVSRLTVRQALSELAREGWLVRMQGRGTFVTRPKVVQALVKLTSFTEDMILRGMAASGRMIDAGVHRADPGIVETLHLPLGANVIVLRRLRFADQEPIALEESFLPHARFVDLLDHFDGTQSLYEVLRKRYGVRLGHAYQSLEATVASGEVAPLLDVKPGAPLLLLERHTLDVEGTDVEFVRSLYRGDRYRFYANLVRED